MIPVWMMWQIRFILVTCLEEIDFERDFYGPSFHIWGLGFQ